MNCPTCGYDVDPTTGLTCPRCTETLDCTSLDCSECGACSGLFEDVRDLFAGRERKPTSDDDDRSG